MSAPLSQWCVQLTLVQVVSLVILLIARALQSMPAALLNHVVRATPSTMRHVNVRERRTSCQVLTMSLTKFSAISDAHLTNT